MARKTKQDPTASINVHALPPDIVAGLDGKPLWRPLSKFHEDILTADTDEVLIWGAKASGKSSASRVKAMRGRVPTKNGIAAPGTDENGNLIPWNVFQCWHPDFKGLVLRESSGDLDIWFKEFLPLAEKIGGVPVASPKQIRWPFGGITDFGHLQDEGAWRKYVGNERHHAIWEEAVTVADTRIVNSLATCLRSPNEEIGVQLILNCNPLGPGLGWISDRYYKIRGGNGKDEIVEIDGEPVYGREIVVKPKQVITRRWFVEGTWNVRTYQTLFGTLKDNPIMDTPQYRASMMADPRLRRAYLEGVPDFESGSYFKSFRPEGPEPGEPAEASHVWSPEAIQPMLEPWYPVWVGVDWGYNHNAVATFGHGGAGGRLYVVDEYLQRGLSVDEMGFQVGLRLLPYIRRGQYVTVYMPHDTFSRESEVETEARRFMSGIARATDGRVIDASGEAPPADDERTEERPERKGYVVMKRAINRRVHGASRLTSLLRWQPFLSMEEGHPFDDVTAPMRLTDEGLKRYEQYRVAVSKAEGEVLPKLIISRRCEQCIEAIKKAPIDPKDNRDVLKGHWTGADSYDSVRYLVESIPLRDLETPPDVMFERKVRALYESDMHPMSKEINYLRLQEDLKKKQSAAIRPVYMPLPMSRRLM